MSRVVRLVALLALTASTALAQEDVRPVVLTGADLPLLVGAPLTAPVCFAWRNGAWEQCPLQIDERAFLDPGSAFPPTLTGLYGAPAQLLYSRPRSFEPANFTPYVPYDSDPAFDVNDELVLLARLFGEQSPAPSTLPHITYPVSEVAFEGRYVYLYVPSTPLDQAASLRFVNYTFQLLAGTFPTNYDFSNRYTSGDKDKSPDGDLLGANPEYSTVATPFYRTTFEDRWIQRELQTTNGSGGYGPDLLDRVKYGARPDLHGAELGSCGRSDYTASMGQGTLGVMKNGPLRGIRFAQGFNSGPLSSVTHLFYERGFQVISDHRVHATRGSTMYFDYSQAARGMSYTSNLFPQGVPLDGVRDRPEGNYYITDFLRWDYLLGAQGTLISTWATHTNVPRIFPTSYQLDATSPEVVQCTGEDLQALGNTGNVALQDGLDPSRNGLPATDPRRSDAYTNGVLNVASLQRYIVPEAPGLTPSQAQAVVQQLQLPRSVQVTRLDSSAVADLLPPVVEGQVTNYVLTGTVRDNRPLDTGLASLSLGVGSSNLSLSVSPFTAGTSTMPFTVSLVDDRIQGAGQLLAIDVAGNLTPYPILIEAAPPPEDTRPPTLTGTFFAQDDEFRGEASDNRTGDTGLANVYINSAASNLVLTLPVTFAPGQRSVSFIVRKQVPAQVGSGYVVALDQSGKRDSLLVNLHGTALPDTLAPLLTGSSADAVFTGTATDDRPNDRGLSQLRIGDSEINLSLSVAPFVAGAPSTTFSVTLTDLNQAGSGFVEAVDQAGNRDSLWISISALPADTLQPQLAGTLLNRTFNGSATDSLALDRGLDSITLLPGANNLVLDVTPFTPGAPVAAFTLSAPDIDADAQGYVLATDRAGNTDSLLVAIPRVPADTLQPQLAGTLNGFLLTGMATDSRPLDRGLASLTLAATSPNLALYVDPFEPGIDSTAFTVMLVSMDEDGFGYVVATDLMGNADSLRVDIAGLPADTLKPILSGTATGQVFQGTAADNRPQDRGLDRVQLSATAANLLLTVNPLTLEAGETIFSVNLANAGLDGVGFVIATDRAGNSDSLLVQLVGIPPDSEAPILAGTLTAQTYNGTATDNQPSDTGVQSVTLAPGAINVTLTVVPFTPGVASASFSLTLINPDADGSGSIRSRDVAGNQSTLAVMIPRRPPADTAKPIITGRYRKSKFEGTASDNRPTDTGIQSILASPRSLNLRVSVGTFTPGVGSLNFSAQPGRRGQPAYGFVIARDRAGNQDSVYVALNGGPATPPPSMGGRNTGATIALLETTPSEALSVVYPNPANPSTTLRLFVPDETTVRIEIFDMTGRYVGELGSGVLSQGWHAYLFDGSNRASGIYLYRIRLNNREINGSFALLK